MGPWLSLTFALGVTGSLAPLEEPDVWRAVQWMVEMKDNQRGPYVGVAWFCRDGTVMPPKSYACRKHGGGIQHGVPGPRAKQLAKMGIYVGTILSALKPEDLSADDYYRARALIVERYLERALDGWVLKGARSYRGFRQIEDEQEAARQLLIVLCQDPSALKEHRSMIVRLVRSLPYGSNSSLADEIRARATVLGDADSKFASLRFKIHAMPEPSDIAMVEAYANDTSSELASKARGLAARMRQHYDPAARRERLKSVRRWVGDDAIRTAIDQFVTADPEDAVGLVRSGLTVIDSAAATLRPGTTSQQGERNLLALHVMALVEELWLGATAGLARTPMTRSDGIAVVEMLVRGAWRLGLLSDDEHQNLERSFLEMRNGSNVAYVDGLQYVRRALEWGRARVVADVGLALAQYRQVEPQANHVVDEVLRSGVMLPLAVVLDRLTVDAEALGLGGHRLVGVDVTTPVARGENPGLGKGPLRHVVHDGDWSTVTPEDIVVVTRLAPDLPRVSGIISTESGGSLSHVALLARNLGIPHALVSPAVAQEIAGWKGQRVVLGVSARHRVFLGLWSELSTDEQEQISAREKHPEAMVSVAPERLDFSATQLLSLTDISAADQGVRVGPKAAELARLKRFFPEVVSPALVIPFGCFVQHVNRPGPDGEPSPLAQLHRAFALAAKLPSSEADPFMVAALSRFRDAIDTVPWADGFVDHVKRGLTELGPSGTFGVFVRSDTNVEDLRVFTGAGLNLTVPNQVQTEDILRAVRAVWASPFSVRAYQWRKEVLATPEHVYPAVLLHRTVPADVSGVMVTGGLGSGVDGSLTVSVAEGVSGVVHGGMPEAIRVSRDGSVRLLSSARSPTCRVIPPPPEFGVAICAAHNRGPLLTDTRLRTLRRMADRILQRAPPVDDLPWEIEFGFVGDRLYLLQMRPLGASRAPATQPFLRALDADLTSPDRPVDLAATISSLGGPNADRPQGVAPNP